ncbi:ArnT family glycosyltransferase [Pelomicrobium sp.]|jgi:4-amino-4-deoxy-L-arabinose transferase-like glycosyltransferase|uniref:ArnT family glycosyltransferase n=1 Tax=Pelomicrobium sp. TaxID=2815319 RepID=UPI002FDD693F
MRRFKPAAVAFVLALWLLPLFVTLEFRPILPVDETRVVSVAWEMWNRGDFLVPSLNGVPYADKPPLLFWIIHLGWALTGVNAWWPRLVPALFALACLYLTHRLGRRLWPQMPEAAGAATLVLLGTTFWSAFSTGLVYDTTLSFFVLCGALGLLHAWQGRRWQGFALFGVSAGLGILAKGPVALLHLGLPALTAPWWMQENRPPWSRWYLGLAAATLLGLVLAAAWALPAARAGGEAYAQQILWHQTADRMVSAFAHRRPFWWYLPLLPLLLFPWIAWPPLWRSLRSLIVSPDSGIRLTLIWSGLGLVAFSLLSGKQAHYLLPLLPPFALLAGRGLAQNPAIRPSDVLLPAAGLVLLGGLFSLTPFLGARLHLPSWTEELPVVTGLTIAGAGLALAVLKFSHSSLETAKLALASVFTVATFQAGLSLPVWGAYDLGPISARLKVLEDDGAPLAHVGKYHGQFQFLGRLEHPLEVIEPRDLSPWLARHPSGRAIVYLPPGDPLLDEAEFLQPFRSRFVAIVGARAVARLAAGHPTGMPTSEAEP